MDTEERGAKFLNYLYRLVKYNRFFQSPINSPFTALDTYILTYIHLGLVSSPREVAGYLHVSSGVVKRVIERLVEWGYVIEEESVPANTVSLTQEAKEMLAKGGAAYNERTARLYDGLSSEQQEFLFSCWHRIGDSAGVRTISIAGEHPSRPSLRRFTIAIGLLGSTFLGHRIAPHSWHLLEHVANSPEHERTPTALSEARNVSRGGITYLLNNMEQDGWISRQQSPSDHRSTIVSLAADGEALLAELRRQANSFLEQHLAPLGDAAIARFITLMGLLTGGEEKPLGSLATGHPDLKHEEVPRPKVSLDEKSMSFVSVVLTVVDNPQEAIQFRKWFIQEIVRRDLLDYIPGRILDEGSVAIAAVCDTRLIGLIQVRRAEQRPEGTIDFMLPLVDEFSSLQSRFVESSRKMLACRGCAIVEDGTFTELSVG